MDFTSRNLGELMMSAMDSFGHVFKTFRLAILALASVSFLGCMKAPDPTSMAGENSSHSPEATRAPHVHSQAPSDWTETVPEHSFYLNTWSLPGGGIANISYLSTNTKIIADNIDRWIGEWTTESGAPVDQIQRYELEGSILDTIMIALEGTLVQTRQLGGGPARENWIFFGAVILTDMGPLYFKAIGPINSLKDQKDEVEAMLKTLTVD